MTYVSSLFWQNDLVSLNAKAFLKEKPILPAFLSLLKIINAKYSMEHFQQEELFIFLSRITCSKVDTKDTDRVNDSYTIVCLCMCLDA